MVTGTSGLFPQAFVYNFAGALLATRDLVEVGATGRYTDTGYTPVAAANYVVQFITYTDALHTIESAIEGRVQEVYSVTTLLADVTSIQADTTLLLAQVALVLADTAAILVQCGLILADTTAILVDTAALLVLANDISEIQRSEVRIVPQGSPLGGPAREDRLNAAAVVIATGLAYEDEQGTIPYREQGMNDRKRLT
jgi:hypothetical protein